MGGGATTPSIPHKFFPDFSRIFLPAMVDNLPDKRFLFSTFLRIFVLLLPDREVDNTSINLIFDLWMN